MATNKEIVEGVYASFAQGDVPAVLGAMADEIQWAEADGFPLAGTYVGPQAVLDGVFMRLGEIGDEFSAVPDQIVAEGDTVVAIGNYTWKHKDSGEPAGGEDGPRVDRCRRQTCDVSATRRHGQGPRTQLTSIGRRGRFTHHDPLRSPGL